MTSFSLWMGGHPIPPTPMKVGPSPATVLTLSAQRAEENLWRHFGVVGSGQAGDQA